MFEAKNISKSYGKRLIIDNVSLSVASGSSAVVVGRNGVGKSTLLSVFAGFLAADSGVVNSDRLGFLPQSDNLFEQLKVLDNIVFWQKAAKAKNLPKELMELFGVWQYADKKVKTLSGGMKKSVALCCAMVHEPDVLVLDEPFASLDMFYKKELIQSLAKLITLGKTIIYTCHSTDEMTALNSQMYMLENAQLSPMERAWGT